MKVRGELETVATVDARISDICNSDEYLERILVINLPDPSFHISFYFRLPLFSMPAGRLEELPAQDERTNVVNPRSFL